jgi:hypothetical protein
MPAPMLRCKGVSATQGRDRWRLLPARGMIKSLSGGKENRRARALRPRVPSAPDLPAAPQARQE